MSKKREQREAKKGKGGSTIKRAANERRTWEPPSLNLPTNTPLFFLKDAEPKRIDVLNYRVGNGNPKADKDSYYYERRFWIHKGFGADGRQSFVCTARTFGKKCAGCDYVSKLQRDPDADPDLVKKLLPKERQILNIIDRKDVDKGVQIWETSYHGFGKLLELKIQNQDDDDNYQDFADWEGGLTLKCDIEDDKVFGKSVVGIEFKQRKDYDPEEIEDKVYCLDELIKEPSYAEQQKLVLGMEEDSNTHEKNNSRKFKESDVTKIQNMTEKELKKFCINMDIDEVDFEELDTLKEMREAVLTVVKESLGESDGKKNKKVDKKPKKEVEDEDEDEDEDIEEDEESEDEDEDEDEESEDEDEESEDEESEDEDEESEDEEDEDEESEDEESEDEESEDEESEDEEDEDEEDEDEDEDETPKKRGRPKKK